MKYLFKTHAQMKEYNRENYWVDNNLVQEIWLDVNNSKDAFKKYIDTINEKYYDIVSKNSIKNKQPIYVDTENGSVQVGFVLTGKIEIPKNDYKWTTQYIDLWVEIFEMRNIFKECD